MEMNYQQLDFSRNGEYRTGHATTALSTMLDNKRLVIDVPDIANFFDRSQHISER